MNLQQVLIMIIAVCTSAERFYHIRVGTIILKGFSGLGSVNLAFNIFSWICLVLLDIWG